MLFIGDRTTKKFVKMINPISIEISPSNDCELYVLDSLNHLYSLIFESHKELANTLENLYNTGSSKCFCVFGFYRDNPIMEAEREINYWSIDEIEFDEGRTL